MAEKESAKIKNKEAPTKLGPLKITAVGDGMVGKTCLLITYTTKRFPTEYVPTVFDNFSDNIVVDGQNYDMTLWDTAGQEDYERIRPLSYHHTKCFLLCFSIGNRTSYDNIVSKWYPELRHYCPKVPIVLVGTKTDLREDSSIETLSRSDGRKLKKKLQLAKYMECSALKGEGLRDIFIEAIRASVSPKKKTCCCVPM